MCSDPIHLQDETYWEMMWAPYDWQTYQTVLDFLSPHDIVVEIGAGDLRLSHSISRVCQHVYAVEVQNEILNKNQMPVPDNMTIIHQDARFMHFPQEITAAVLLMRHCTHFNLYAEKLSFAGCRRLITNARWRMGVEVIDLQADRMPYQDVNMGWYSCWCGSVGFVPGPPENYTPEIDSQINEVASCPRCCSQAIPSSF